MFGFGRCQGRSCSLPCRLLCLGVIIVCSFNHKRVRNGRGRVSGGKVSCIGVVGIGVEIGIGILAGVRVGARWATFLVSDRRLFCLVSMRLLPVF